MKFTRLQLVLIFLSAAAFVSGFFYRNVRPLDNGKEETPVIISDTPVADTYSYEPIHKEISPQNVPEASEATGGVNINAAGMDELMTLPRVGKKTAQAIIRYRREHGPFKSVDELTAIRGIGRKTVARFRGKAYAGPSGSDVGTGSLPKEAQNQKTTSSHIERKAAATSGSSSTGTSSSCGPGIININTASREELISLPRIGPATAEKIIRYRTENGPFPTVDSLVKVKGIGPKTLERLRDKICVGP